MIATDKFVFVHLPRSGGTFVAGLIARFFPSSRMVGYHLPLEFLPAEYSHLPILGAIRNPWDFYVSWYHHVLPRDAATPLVSWMSDYGKLDFKETTRNALNLGTDTERLDRLIQTLPEEVDYQTKNIPNITKAAMRRVQGSGIGYYTFRFNHLFGNRDDIYFCRFENFTRDLLSFFGSIDAVTAELEQYVLHAEKQNTSEHRHYSQYYSAELASLVSLRDGGLIQRFGYCFETARSEQAMHRSGMLGNSG
jgi:hypothetical protein